MNSGKLIWSKVKCTIKPVKSLDPTYDINLTIPFRVFAQPETTNLIILEQEICLAVLNQLDREGLRYNILRDERTIDWGMPGGFEPTHFDGHKLYRYFYTIHGATPNSAAKYYARFNKI